MDAGRFEPVPDGPRPQAKGMFEGHQGKAPTDQGDDDDDEGLVGAAAMKEGPGAGAESLAPVGPLSDRPRRGTIPSADPSVSPAVCSHRIVHGSVDLLRSVAYTTVKDSLTPRNQ